MTDLYIHTKDDHAGDRSDPIPAVWVNDGSSSFLLHHEYITTKTPHTEKKTQLYLSVGQLHYTNKITNFDPIVSCRVCSCDWSMLGPAGAPQKIPKVYKSERGEDSQNWLIQAASLV